MSFGGFGGGFGQAAQQNRGAFGGFGAAANTTPAATGMFGLCSLCSPISPAYFGTLETSTSSYRSMIDSNASFCRFRCNQHGFWKPCEQHSWRWTVWSWSCGAFCIWRWRYVYAATGPRASREQCDRAVWEVIRLALRRLTAAVNILPKVCDRCETSFANIPKP